MVEFVPTPVEIELVGQCAMASIAGSIREVPGGLYPLRTAAFEMDEYRFRYGWPVSVPPLDIRSEALFSVTGESFGVRDDITSITPGSAIRWIAHENFYDDVALEWRPFKDATGFNTTWRTGADFAPVFINDYEYRVKDERFRMNALNFDSDSRCHMWADFSPNFGAAVGYTVIMVMSPNSVYGNNVAVPYNGIWCPGGETPGGVDTFTETPDDSWQGVHLQGGYLYLLSESRSATRALGITSQLNTNAPTYLAIVFGRPNTVFYAGPGPSSIRVNSVNTGATSGSMNWQIALGRSTGDILHTADMALMELNIYPNRLTGLEIQNEFSILSGAYGGDS